MTWPVPMATSKQIAAIHVLAGKAGMDEDTRRAFLVREAEVASTKLLTAAKAAHVIDRLQALAGKGGEAGAKGALRLDGPYAAKLRALWIAGHDLGVVRDRTDKALCAFIERQTGISHPRWLREPANARRAIEGLKGWLAREGITWPARQVGQARLAHDQPQKRDITDVKRAVLNAQWLRLVAIGAVRPFTAHQPLADLDAYAFKVGGLNGWCFFEPKHYDQVQAALGRKLRAALNARKDTP